MNHYTGYLAIHKFEAELERELELKGLTVAQKLDRLYLVEGDHPAMIWAQMTAFGLERISISSSTTGPKSSRPSDGTGVSSRWPITAALSSSKTSYRRFQINQFLLGTHSLKHPWDSGLS